MPIVPTTGFTMEGDEIVWTAEEGNQAQAAYLRGLGLTEPDLFVEDYTAAFEDYTSAYDLIPAPMYAYGAGIAADLAADAMVEDGLGGSEQYYAAKKQMLCLAAYPSSDAWGVGGDMNNIGADWGGLDETGQGLAEKFCERDAEPDVPDSPGTSIWAADPTWRGASLSPGQLQVVSPGALTVDPARVKPDTRTRKAGAWGLVAVLAIGGLGLVAYGLTK